MIAVCLWKLSQQLQPCYYHRLLSRAVAVPVIMLASLHNLPVIMDPSLLAYHAFTIPVLPLPHADKHFHNISQFLDQGCVS